MKEIIAALALAMQELKTKADAALRGMGPIDQYQGSQEVAYAIRSLDYTKDCVEEMLTQVAGVMEKYDGTIAAEAEPIAAKLLADKIAAGEFLPKADAETAIELARTEGRTAASTEFEAEKKKIATIAARRTEISDAHGADAASLLSDDDLGVEDFAALKLEFARRATTLEELDVKASEKKEAFGEMACSMPFDEDGSKVFDRRIATLKQISAPKTPASAALTKKPVTPVAGSGESLIAATQQQESNTAEVNLAHACI